MSYSAKVAKVHSDLQAKHLGARQECGPDAARQEGALQLAVGAFALELEGEQILGGDDLAFHPHHFGDVRHPAPAVAHALHLADQVNR